jgi:hypothetical protein
MKKSNTFQMIFDCSEACKQLESLKLLSHIPAFPLKRLSQKVIDDILNSLVLLKSDFIVSEQSTTLSAGDVLIVRRLKLGRGIERCAAKIRAAKINSAIH